MAIRIEDGKGNGFAAAVSSKHFLQVESYTRDAMVLASSEGVAFSISSGFVNVSELDAYHGILYTTHDDVKKFYVQSITISSNSTSYLKWEVIKNPTSGTLVSSGTTVTPINFNFASGETYNGTSKAGGNGFTITNGTILDALVYDGGSAQLVPSHSIILSRGNSVGIRCAKIGAGTDTVCVVINGYFREAE